VSFPHHAHSLGTDKNSGEQRRCHREGLNLVSCMKLCEGIRHMTVAQHMWQIQADFCSVALAVTESSMPIGGVMILLLIARKIHLYGPPPLPPSTHLPSPSLGEHARYKDAMSDIFLWSEAWNTRCYSCYADESIANILLFQLQGLFQITTRLLDIQIAI